MQFKSITDLSLTNKKVFIRVDMNVPIDGGSITDVTRIKASLPTIRHVLNQGGKVILATHLGRPTEGTLNQEDSVSPIATYISQELGFKVPVVTNFNSSENLFTNNENLVMLENVRVNPGEKKNSEDLGKKYASICDVFCYDAFATAHRAEASTNSIGHYAPEICAGLLMSQELSALNQAINAPKAPVVAIVGGSKVSTKLTILENLAKKVDYLIVGGGILNTFLLASGYNIGKSLVEKDLVSAAKNIIEIMKSKGKTVPLPTDVIVADEFSKEAKAITKSINEIQDNDIILDVGPQFANQLAKICSEAGTIIWNGPLGVFEFEQFSQGTKALAQAIANSKAFSLAGGGDTIAAINKFNLYGQISYISTAGGALLEFLEGKELPAIKLLNQ